MTREGWSGHDFSEVILDCDHPFIAEIKPRWGDILWCSRCRKYSSYGQSNVRRRRRRDYGIVPK